MEKRVNREEQVNWKLSTAYLDFFRGTKVNEFADLTTSDIVSEYAGYEPNIMWSGRKHLGTHEYVDEPLDQVKPCNCFQLSDERPSFSF